MAEQFNVFGSVYIDGVPVKLNEKFKPSPEVTLPADFEIGNPTEVLFMEYDFSLEESVIAWSEERQRHLEQIEQHKTKLELEKKKQQELLEEKQKEEALKAAETAVRLEAANKNIELKTAKQTVQNEDNLNATDTNFCNKGELQISERPDQPENIRNNQLPPTFSVANNTQPHTTSNNSVQSNFQPHYKTINHNPPFSSGHQQQQFSSQINKNQPVFYSVGQDILTPLPAMKSQISSGINSSKQPSFNPADFENELDPFDNLELKTIDDMKELDKVLQSVQIASDGSEAVVGSHMPYNNMQSGSGNLPENGALPTNNQNRSANTRYVQNISKFQQTNYSANVSQGYSTSGLTNTSTSTSRSAVTSINQPVRVLPSSLVNVNTSSGAVSFKAVQDPGGKLGNVQPSQSSNNSVASHTGPHVGGQISNIAGVQTQLQQLPTKPFQNWNSPSYQNVAVSRNNSHQQPFSFESSTQQHVNVNSQNPLSLATSIPFNNSTPMYSNTNTSLNNGGSSSSQFFNRNVNNSNITSSFGHGGNISSNYVQSVHNTTVSSSSSGQSSLGGMQPYSTADNVRLSQPVAPQHFNQYEVWREFLQKSSSSTSSNSQVPSSFQNPAKNNLSYQNNLPLLCKTLNNNPNGINRYVPGINYSQFNENSSGARSHGNSRSNTPPPGMGLGRLRNARSTPDLVALGNSDNIINDRLSVNNMSKSPPVFRKRKEDIHAIGASAATSSTGDTDKQSSFEIGNIISTQVSTSTDPYRSMSGEQKRFVDNLTNMGFKRIIVARAVQRMGLNEKLVLDFLCAITRLTEKGLSEVDSEKILLLPEKDQQKAQDYLLLCQRFKEFGFTETKIQEGLLKCNFNEEKTLDWLTSH